MGAEHQNWVDGLPLKCGAKFVLYRIASYCNGDGWCWLGQGKLGALTGQSERAVRDHLSSLETADPSSPIKEALIRRERRVSKSGQRTFDGFQLLGPFDPDQTTVESDRESAPDPNRQNLPVDLEAYRQNPSGLPAESVGPTGRIRRYSIDDGYLDKDLDRPCGERARDPGDPDFIEASVPVHAMVCELVGVDDSWPGYMDRMQIRRWLAAGADPELDIYPTIARVMAERGAQDPPRGIKYFDQPVLRHVAERGQPIPEVKTLPGVSVSARAARPAGIATTRHGMSPTLERMALERKGAAGDDLGASTMDENRNDPPDEAPEDAG